MLQQNNLYECKNLKNVLICRKTTLQDSNLNSELETTQVDMLNLDWTATNKLTTNQPTNQLNKQTNNQRKNQSIKQTNKQPTKEPTN